MNDMQRQNQSIDRKKSRTSFIAGRGPRRALGIAILLGAGWTPEASADPPDSTATAALGHNVALLDEVLRESTADTVRAQKIAAITGITIGTALLGLGTWRLVERDPPNAYSRGVGVGFMVAGAANLTAGVFAATRVTHETKRLERWDRALQRGIGEDELLRFEGELRASNEVREGERLLLRWTSLTNALAGATVIALAVVPGGSSNTDRLAGYVAGGIFVAVGMSLFATTFRPLPSETAWSEYSRRRAAPARAGARIGVVPSVSRRGAGLSVGGMF